MTLTLQDVHQLPCLHAGEDSLIYRWEDSDYGLPVIIKIAKAANTSPRQLSRLVNEYQLTRDTDILGMRKALDYINIEDSPALVLEYVEGKTLKGACINNQQPLSELLTVALGITRSVTSLHQSGIVHQRINSNNIFFDQSSQHAYLIDFADALRTKENLSTPKLTDISSEIFHYISPEQTGRLDCSIDLQSDLYSLGIVFYELFTGKLPYLATTPAELIHCHIARVAAPVRKLDPEIPQVLSDIIAKLMQKNVSDRYQSAHGLLKDLENCEEQLASDALIKPFTLGRHDSSGIFSIPRKFYGREEELRRLSEAFDEAKKGRGSCLLFYGEAGIGKSALLAEFKHHIMLGDGHFISGEYQEHQDNTPYSAIIDAINEKIDQILAEDSGKLNFWRAKLDEVQIDKNSAITEILPRLQLIISEETHLTERLRSEEHNQHSRVHIELLHLLSAFSEAGQPLVFCIDNLQWADRASVDFFKRLWRDGDNQAVLFLGAFRGSSKGPEDSVSKRFDLPDGTPTPFSVVPLTALSVNNVSSLICDTLNCNQSHVNSLVNVIHEKTNGVPLLTLQVLKQFHEESILEFNTETRQWQWDIEKIRTYDALMSVLELMSQKMDKFPPETKELLSLAACFGNDFDLASLAAISGRSPHETLQHLRHAVDTGFVQPLDTNFRLFESGDNARNAIKSSFSFTHNRIRNAASSSISRKEYKKIHLAIGKLQLQKTQDDELEIQIFDIVSHLNKGFQYIDNADDRLKLAELNLVAGRKAKRLAAYQTAIWYLSMGIGMLPADKWLSHKTLTADLYQESINAEYLSGHSERSEVLLKETLKHIDDPRIKAKLYELKLLFCAESGMPLSEIESVLAEIKTSEDVEELQILIERLSKNLILRGRGAQISLDSETVVKVSRMLSQEIKLDQLLNRLLHIVIENAGAEKGVLIEQRGDELRIQGEKIVDSGEIKTMQSIPIEKSGIVPLSVVNYVARTQQLVVLNDACADSIYAHDCYIAEKQIKSLLCLPINSNGRLLAILYLENSLTTNVFTPDRLELLKAIASQAAISLDNAKLYTDLEEKFNEIRRAEDLLRNQTEKLEQEIKGHQRTTLALKESETRLRSLFEGSPIGMYRTTLDGLALNVNTSLAHMLGYANVTEFIEKINFRGTAETVWKSIEDRGAIVERAKAAQGRYVYQEVSLRRKDGKSVDTNFYMMLSTDPFTKEPNLVGFVEDITERKRLEENLHQSQKMESIGRLAGGVAHDFNNMLTVIIGSAEMAMFKTSEEEPAYSYLETILTAAERSTAITRQLLAFSRKEIISPKAINLNALIIESEKTLVRLIHEDIQLTFNLGTGLWPIMLDPSQLDQILINLFVNASDAMPTGGSLNVATANIQISPEDSDDHIDAQPGDYVQLAVSDSGFGMEQEVCEHIFEPFYTTKDVGQGTGLGLATVYGIVTQNNGFITVNSKPGHGTSFTVFFPRFRETVEEEQPPTEVHTLGSGTVLLVEDEEMLLWISSQMLENLGYEVITAATPKEAISICEQQGSSIDLLLTDVVMPEMNGKEMVEKIKVSLPELPVLFMSGYPADIVAQRGILKEDMNFIKKPLMMNQLREKIQSILKG